MNTIHAVLGWGLLVVAIAAWGAVAWWIPHIQTMVKNHEVAAQESVQRQMKDVAAIRMHALVFETAAERTRLAAFARTDIVDAAKKIEGAGLPTGVRFRVRDASVETIAGLPRSSPLQPIGFVIDGDGTFAQLMHAVALLQSLPFPLQIEQLDISSVPADAVKELPVWHANLRVRLLTAAPIPS